MQTKIYETERYYTMKSPDKIITLVTYKLSNKGRKVVVLEELADNFRGKELRILDDKGHAIVRPASNLWIASVNHMVGF